MSVQGCKPTAVLVVIADPEERASIQRSLAPERVQIFAEENGEAALQRFLARYPPAHHIVRSGLAGPQRHRIAGPGYGL